MIKHIESGISGRGLGSNYVLDIEKTASNLNLTGSVFSRDDGSIKVIAEGEEKSLIKFIKKLEKGTFMSSVENFYVKWS